MDKHFPSEFFELWKNPNTKKAWVSEIEPKLPSDCPNCGGAGFLSTFIAYEGPYNYASTNPKKVSHYDDGKWWIGETYTAPCPCCPKTLKSEPNAQRL